ncbi:MAG: glycosyltransferase [Candidatus Aenigmarchaeota archaeon]|nr:glycosyltransferase [Candidatus Aenigmarchaeota archaeon]MDW8149391.1 glycosyltransferase [Candidatus Aenigmarchaeota archaeon]
MKHKIDAILTIYNEIKNLKTCLHSLFNQTLPPNRLIVVDAGSTDGSIEFIKNLEKKYPIKLIVKKGCNRSEGRNIGIRQSSTEYIFCLNADVKLYRDCIENLLKTIASDKKIGATGGIQVFPKTQTNIAKAIWHLPRMSELSEVNLPAIREKSTVEVKNVPCECCIWRRKALLEAGLFNEKLNYGEDPELHYRMRKKGWRIVATRNAKFEHVYKNTITKFSKQQILYGIGGFSLLIHAPAAAIEILGWKIYVSLMLPLSLILLLINQFLFWTIVIIVFSILLTLCLIPAVKAFQREKNIRLFFLVLFLQFIKHLTNLIGFYIGVFYEIRRLIKL